MTTTEHEGDELAPKRRQQAWAEFRHHIRALLDEARPTRVDEDDRVWREPIYGWARAHMPDETELVRRIAKNEVDRQEGHATKRGNEKLRDFWEGREPLDWGLIGPYPVLVDRTRVRLDGATRGDIEVAASQLHTHNIKNFEAAEAAVAALRYLAERAKQQGLNVVAELGNLPPHQQPRAADA